jgi:3-hydroxyacyl-CoA dehydrogenase/enoyl-CoA hydratase/3-hydroxybutyryl-CoA epimerase
MNNTPSLIRLERDADNVATLWFDAPGKSVNTITPLLLEQLSNVLSELMHNEPAGLIFASAKKGFVAGADLFEIRKMDRDQLANFLAEGQRVFQHVATLPFPTAVAINGDCLGGGYELALACTYRVSTDEGSVNIGLPETKLGILPAWGGTTRLPRLIGLPKALGILLPGKTLPPRKALKMGLIDETVRPEAVRVACKRLIMKHAERKELGWTQRVAAGTSLLRNRILATATAQTRDKTYGHYPAPLKLIEVLRSGYENGFDAGLRAEIEGIGHLMDTEACRNLMRLFFLQQGAKRDLAKELHVPAKPVKHVAVIGAGVMGAGICHVLARSGIQVRLLEVNAEALSKGLCRVRSLLDEDVAAGKLSPIQARDAMHRVAPSMEWTGLELADVVIEAVVEKLELKREIFTKLERLVRPDCVLASNTSSLLVTDIAGAAVHDHRVVGIHFFNPVSKMPLVEIVRTPHSDDQSLATAVGLAARIGKTPVLVNDGPGFLVNRVLIPYLAEAMAIAVEGTPIPVIDLAARRWGMPMGPFELLDEIGLDVSHHVLSALDNQLGGKLPKPPVALDQMLQRGWLGKKSGTGFYVYPKNGKRGAQADLNQEVAAMLSTGKETPADSADSQEQIAWRLVLPMVNEAAKLLEQGITSSTDSVDLATVLGTGLAPFRGGLVHFADSAGLDVIVGKLTELAAKHGERFEPAALLRDLALRHHHLSEFNTDASTAPAAPTPSWRSEHRQEH